MSPEMDPLVPAPLCVDAAGVGRLLGISVRSVRRLADAGKLPAPVAIGGSRRWLIADIEEWLRDRKR